MITLLICVSSRHYRPVSSPTGLPRLAVQKIVQRQRDTSKNKMLEPDRRSLPLDLLALHPQNQQLPFAGVIQLPCSQRHRHYQIPSVQLRLHRRSNMRRRHFCAMAVFLVSWQHDTRQLLVKILGELREPYSLNARFHSHSY